MSFFLIPKRDNLGIPGREVNVKFLAVETLGEGFEDGTRSSVAADYLLRYD
jgi:hypothetical protein